MTNISRPQIRSGSRIDPSWSLNEVLRRQPTTTVVLNAFGLDVCCGGARSLAEAAAEDGVDIDVLLAALEASLEEGDS
jgi:regulator of cell morphogenesis and NO signaling